jgi:imidazolonepropionase-like amidohydrolase
VLIKNGHIKTMNGKDYENGYVLAGDNGKIIDVGDMSRLNVRETDGTKVIDATGCMILPGFIDAHCHLGLFDDSMGFEGDDGNEMTDPVTPQLRAIDGIYHMDRGFEEARKAGVTTVVTGPGSSNVIGGQFAALKTAGRRVEDMVIKEPVAMKVAFGENPKTVYNEKKQMPTTRMATAAILRENLKRAQEYAQQLDEYYKDSKNKEKPDYDIKMEALRKVLKREIPIKAHAHRADDILTAIRVAKEFGLRITIEHCTEGHLIKDILAEEGVSAIVGPLISERSKIELKNLSLKVPGILSEAGITVAIMTDHPVVPIQYLSLCAALAVKEGMDEELALKAITINAARIAGIDDRVGSIEPGKDADLVILDGHPFELKTKVVKTIINGKEV